MLVVRLGSPTTRNLTPRMGKDTTPDPDRPGQAPGLSSFEETGPLTGKAQLIDVEQLRPPLRAFRDDPTRRGTPGHVSIAPATAQGEVDLAALERWARCREDEQPHPFTQIVMDAIIDPRTRP